MDLIDRLLWLIQHAWYAAIVVFFLWWTLWELRLIPWFS
jgi:hypothetical protein